MAQESSASSIAGKVPDVVSWPLQDDEPEDAMQRRVGRPREAIRNATSHRRLLMAVSKEYYLEGFTKVQIAGRLGISRFRVARCLDDPGERWPLKGR